MRAQNSKLRRPTGIGQLSLVEHALCPLDPRISLVENLVFDAKYQYSDTERQRQSAHARVFSPLGLSAADELFLWGLLALTLQQPDNGGELFATPHWCLRQLGVINQTSKRGGRQYKQFAEAIRRLSAVTYMSDAFYDPVRAEHRRVSFRFFSYSLPRDLNSCRGWRIAWDPIFFEMVSATAGHFRFDLAVYRELDAASRRLFLFATKVLSRQARIRALSLEHVAVDLLGFSPTLRPKDMRAKVKRCLNKLNDHFILKDSEVFRTSAGNYFVKLARGPYFEERKLTSKGIRTTESPLFETLQRIGFDQLAAARLIKKYPGRLLGEWADITQAAQERFGAKFFKKSPMAYLVDSVSNAAQGRRTPPDWWHELRQAEAKKAELSEQSQEVFARIRQELFSEHVSDKLDPSSNAKEPEVASIANILSGR
jgi:hypothetical protein